MIFSHEQIEIPFNYEPRPEYQKEIFTTDKRNIMLIWARRSGKTKTVLNNQIYRMWQKPGIYHYMFPTFSQAKRVIWQDEAMMAHFPPEIVEKKNESDMTIKLKNGAMWFLVGGDSWENLRGTNPCDVVLDEFAEMKAEVWNYLYRPVLFQNKGRATIVFTPKGTNHAHELMNQALTLPDLWMVRKMKASQNPYIDKKELEAERKTLPEAVFNQEYEVEFLSSGLEVFRRLDECVYDYAQSPMEPEVGHVYKLGIDLAKFNDYSVITPIDLHTMKVGWQDSFNKIAYDIQEARIETAFFKWNKAKTTIDATGVGAPVVDHLQARLGAENKQYLEPFVFTQNTREELLEHLALMIEQKKIRIPNDPELLAELKMFRFAIRSTGNNWLNRRLVMEVPDGKHDDRVMSLALAVWGLREPLRTPIMSMADKRFYAHQRRPQNLSKFLMKKI